MPSPWPEGSDRWLMDEAHRRSCPFSSTEAHGPLCRAAHALVADRDEWRNTAHAAREHYEQSDRKLLDARQAVLDEVWQELMGGVRYEHEADCPDCEGRLDAARLVAELRDGTGRDA